MDYAFEYAFVSHIGLENIKNKAFDAYTKMKYLTNPRWSYQNGCWRFQLPIGCKHMPHFAAPPKCKGYERFHVRVHKLENPAFVLARAIDSDCVLNEKVRILCHVNDCRPGAIQHCAKDADSQCSSKLRKGYNIAVGDELVGTLLFYFKGKSTGPWRWRYGLFAWEKCNDGNLQYCSN